MRLTEGRCSNPTERPFRNFAIFLSNPLYQCLSKETLTAVCPFYLVSMPGEVKYPTRGNCVTCCGLHILEKDISEINHSCVSRIMSCFEYYADMCSYNALTVSILGFENCQSFFPTTAHVRTVCRNARHTAMRGAHQFDWHNTCQTLKTAVEHHIQTTV